MTEIVISMRECKPKLAVDEQIAHLRSKGVTFELCSKDEARRCLSDKTYYFKVAAYRVLFDKRVGGAHDGEYVGLDFGHLQDLAAIDHMLRYTLLPMTLDIEHFAKVKLMREITSRADEDGYSIVREYLASLNEKDRARREKEMGLLKRDEYIGGIARKYEGEKPVWVLTELLSFGGFASFYLFCANKWRNQQMKSEHYLLRQTQAIRNACAHSTDIINGFAGLGQSTIRTPKEVATALDEIGVNRRARRSKMANSHIQQIAMMSFAYKEMVTGSHTREMCRSLVNNLERRAIKHVGWYESNNCAVSAYGFLTKVFDKWVQPPIMGGRQKTFGFCGAGLRKWFCPSFLCGQDLAVRPDSAFGKRV